VIGSLSAGTDCLTGQIDIALLQSLTRRLDTIDLSRYGQIIVDESHHVPAVSLEQVLKALPARYALGHTATPFRRDGQHPILTMQLGPIRYGSPIYVAAHGQSNLEAPLDETYHTPESEGRLRPSDSKDCEPRCGRGRKRCRSSR